MAPARPEWSATKATNIALAYYQLRKYEAASRALDTGGAGTTAQLLRADLALAQGQYAGALTTYNTLLTNETYGRVMRIRVGNALLGMRQFAEAEAQFRAYLDSGDRTAFASARLGLANALYGQGDYSRA
ncbi:MAG: tetratricopeptide repeat protein, partial [Rudanella sp.]|nr:tetratricopeptide repeat protein [Rudanella sp.]